MIDHKKVVFITGGSSGIGEALCKKFLDENYIVGTCGRSREKFFKSSLNLKKNIHFIECDITDERKTNEMFDGFFQDFGLDVFIANAGIGIANKQSEYNSELDKKITLANVNGFLNSLGPAIKFFESQNHGKIATISSLGGLFGLPRNAAYCASKAFVKTYSDSLTYDLRKNNIDVICIYPGYVKTPLTENNNHPMPFLMDASEVANRIFKSIERNSKSNLYFPFPFATVSRLLAVLPRSLRSFILKKIVKFN